MINESDKYKCNECEEEFEYDGFKECPYCLSSDITQLENEKQETEETEELANVEPEYDGGGKPDAA